MNLQRFDAVILAASNTMISSEEILVAVIEQLTHTRTALAWHDNEYTVIDWLEIKTLLVRTTESLAVGTPGGDQHEKQSHE